MTALADCGLRIANRKASHGVYPRGLPGRDKPGRSPRNRDSAIYNRQSAVPVPPAGATLFELVIVMAILAIVAAIAIPRFAGAIQIAALDDAVKRVACDLRLAQANAIKKQQQQNVTFDVTNNRYELVGMPNPDHPAASYIVSLTEPPYQGVRFQSADLGGTNTLSFDRFGAPLAPATIILQMCTRQKTVRVAAGTGRVTTE